MKRGAELRRPLASLLGAAACVLGALPGAAAGGIASPAADETRGATTVEATVTVCYNYGCLNEANVDYSSAQLAEIRRLLATARSAPAERAVIAAAVGKLLGWAGEQSPISADKGGNYADAGVDGKMDCIDHSRTTTRLLRLLEAKGMLRFHRVLEPALRHRFLIFEHYSAQIEEIVPGTEGLCRCDGEGGAGGNERRADDTPARYVVDSWFFDNGHPAAVMPLAEWQSGKSPDADAGQSADAGRNVDE